MLRLLTNYELRFFVHQRGQLLRKIGTPDYVLKGIMLKGPEESFSYQISWRISSVDVLEKRADAVPSCNPNLEDEDNAWITNVVDILGCVPAFLKRFLVNSSLSTGNEVTLRCSKEQYSNFSKKLHPKNHFEKWAKLYVEPCTQMAIVVSSEHNLVVKRPACNEWMLATSITGIKEVTLRIEYGTIGFKEIRNYRAFGLLSLWSQIGGFVGIFLGYSLLQVPEIIGDIIAWAKHVMNTT